MRAAFAGAVAALAAMHSCAAAAQGVDSARTTAVLNTAGSLASSINMDFGEIAYSAGGTVVLTAAAAASCTTTGGVVHIGNCQAAMFDGRVRFFFPLQVTAPVGDAIDLTGPGGATMRLDSFKFAPGPGLLSLAANRFLILNLDGSFRFYTGGTLHVSGNQPPGVYTGTFQVELNYN